MIQLRETIQVINPGAHQVDVINAKPNNVNATDLLASESLHCRESFLEWITAGENLLRKLNSSSRRKGLWAQSSLSSAAHQIRSLDIESFSLIRPGEIAGPNLVMWLNLLSTLKGERLLRLKAILNVEGYPIAIHAAQTIVHEPVELVSWPSEERDSRFVVISQGSIRAEFEESLALLDFVAPGHQTTPIFDVEAYQKFLKLAEVMGRASG